MRRFKAQLAGHGCPIAKFFEDEAVPFGPEMYVHE